MHSASQTVQICTCIDVGRYEQEGRGGEGYNGIEGDCERGNAVIEDIFGTGAELELLSLDFRYTYLSDEGIDTGTWLVTIRLKNSLSLLYIISLV